MHDPMVQVCRIFRPWPQASRSFRREPVRWSFGRHHHAHDGTCRQAGHDNPFPWWRLRSWSPFWVLAGRPLYWPPLVTIWHHEPGDRDSGEVCRHFRRWRDETGAWQSTVLHAWQWHIHHWRVQIHPLQHLRRWALTRCTWCGGRATKAAPINVSTGWETPPSPWWRGELGLYHGGCSSAENVLRRCLCDAPLPYQHNLAYGDCARCGKGWHDEVQWAATRDAVALAGLPVKGKPWAWPKEVDVQARRRVLREQS